MTYVISLIICDDLDISFFFFIQQSYELKHLRNIKMKANNQSITTSSNNIAFDDKDQPIL
jgi:hypothetical protein